MIKKDDIILALKASNFWGADQNTGIKRPIYLESMMKLKNILIKAEQFKKYMILNYLK